MSKKQKRTEAEIHTMIVRDSKIRPGCADFAPEFTLIHIVDCTTNWNAGIVRDAADWPRDCAEAVSEAVARARRKFDIAWSF